MGSRPRCLRSKPREAGGGKIGVREVLADALTLWEEEEGRARGIFSSSSSSCCPGPCRVGAGNERLLSPPFTKQGTGMRSVSPSLPTLPLLPHLVNLAAPLPPRCLEEGNKRGILTFNHEYIDIKARATVELKS